MGRRLVDRPVAADARRARIMGGVAVAAEGCWLIAYVPEKAAIAKYKITKI